MMEGECFGEEKKSKQSNEGEEGLYRKKNVKWFYFGTKFVLIIAIIIIIIIIIIT